MRNFHPTSTSEHFAPGATGTDKSAAMLAGTGIIEPQSEFVMLTAARRTLHPEKERMCAELLCMRTIICIAFQFRKSRLS